MSTGKRGNELPAGERGTCRELKGKKNMENKTKPLTYAETLAKFPQILKGWNEIHQNYRNRLIATTSPSVLIRLYLEVEANGISKMHPAYANFIESGRCSAEYLTIRWAIDKVLPGVPADQLKPDPSSPDDQYILDLLNKSYPLARGFQSLHEIERKWLMEKYTAQELFGAFICGVEQYELGILKDSGNFANINAAQLARGVWFIHENWLGSKAKPV
jgi:hypothetical protein